MTIRKAIILAAGKGERMRPYTNTCPKPLLPIGGKPLIEWTIARLKKVGVEEIIVNTSYLGDKIKKHFASAASLYFSEEKEPLETGGGILNCLSFLHYLSGPVACVTDDTRPAPASSLGSLVLQWCVRRNLDVRGDLN